MRGGGGGGGGGGRWGGGGGGGGGGAAAAQVVSGLPGRKSQSPGLLYVQWGRIRLRERDAEWSQWLEVDKEEKDTDIYTRL